MGLSQARAELALAQGKWSDAIAEATTVVDQSRLRHRVKDEALSLATRDARDIASGSVPPWTMRRGPCAWLGILLLSGASGVPVGVAGS